MTKFEDSITLLITGISPRLARLETTVLASLSQPLTHRQYRILFQISAGRTYVTALSDVAQTTVAAVSESVETLVRRGLVTRGSRPGDRRVSTLSLTEQGRSTLAEADSSVRELSSTLAQDLRWDDETTARFATLIRDLADVVRSHPRIMEA